MTARTLAKLIVAAIKRASWKHIHKAADAHEAKLTAVTVGAFDDAKAAISRKALHGALEDRNEAAVFELISEAITVFSKQFKSKAAPVLHETLIASAVAGEKLLRPKLKVAQMRSLAPKVGDTTWKFDKTNVAATEWAADHAADLVKGISKATRESIKDEVESAFDDQFDVDELSDRIYELIGDENRAERIARTEVMKASNAGQQNLWDQAVEGGMLSGNEKKEWIVTPDDRLCAVCEPMDGVVVPMDEPFDVNGELMLEPPVHPNCRCTVGLVL